MNQRDREHIREAVQEVLGSEAWRMLEHILRADIEDDKEKLITCPDADTLKIRARIQATRNLLDTIHGLSRLKE